MSGGIKEDLAMDKIRAFTNEQLKKDLPSIEVGNNVRVYNKIKEGTRERIQLFEGTVIAKKGKTCRIWRRRRKDFPGSFAEC